jgi:hypothetical protein
MAWNWHRVDQEPPPVMTLALIAIAKGTLQCPIRGERYVAMAVLKPSGTWTLFGQGAIREDEVVTHWTEPELPEGFPDGPEMDVSHANDINE